MDELDSKNIGMETGNKIARSFFVVGLVVSLLGLLMLCYCPWMFAIATVLFGISAATAKTPLLRWVAVVFIAAGVSAAIREATNKEQQRTTAIEAELRNAESKLAPVGESDGK